MPISRYLQFLEESGNLQAYMDELVAAFNPTRSRADVAAPRCRRWDGRLYDCDFNQMIDIGTEPDVPPRSFDADVASLATLRIVVGPHWLRMHAVPGRAAEAVRCWQVERRCSNFCVLGLGSFSGFGPNLNTNGDLEPRKRERSVAEADLQVGLDRFEDAGLPVLRTLSHSKFARSWRCRRRRSTWANAARCPD